MRILPTFPAQAPAASLHPEAELLLCCARISTDAARAELINPLLQKGIDWQYLIRTAQAHGVIPLLYRSLHSSCPEAVPQNILDQLQRHFHANAFHNLFLFRELLKVLRLFEANGLPVIPFKGPVLAAMAYGDLSLRQFCDLDIIIHKRDLPRAKELLISQGYQLTLTDAQEAAYLQSHYHLSFIRADSRVTVELHWALAGKYWPFSFDFERLQQRLAPVLCKDTTIPSFQPEDLLLFICVHGAKHKWERLMWICDVAELIRAHQQMDWQRLLKQAETSGSKRILFLGLFLANDLLRTDLPEDVLQRIQAAPKVKLLAEQVRAQLFVRADRPPFHAFAFHLKVRERLPNKIQYFVYYPFRIHIAHLRSLFETATADEKEQIPLFLPSFLASFYSRRLRPFYRVAEYELRRVKALLKAPLGF